MGFIVYSTNYLIWSCIVFKFFPEQSGTGVSAGDVTIGAPNLW
jgi:hypothetical protein